LFGCFVCVAAPFNFNVNQKQVRVWDASARGLLCRARIHAPASCCAWSPDGRTIVVGTIQGDFAVLGIGEDGGVRVGLQSIMVKQLLRTGADNLHAKTELQKKERKATKKKQMTPMQRKMRAIQGEMSDSPTGQKPFKRHEEVQDMKFSPDGCKLAIASRDNNIYIYDIDEDGSDLHIMGVCRGHSSYVTHIDWSEDSTSLQSNDGTYELLYWDASTAKQVRDCGCGCDCFCCCFYVLFFSPISFLSFVLLFVQLLSLGTVRLLPLMP